ncbi:MAG: Ig-like domain-containing protein [Saprospiraceae bacterium]|nr:Ig-like domain-containing protein [Saprospiraceae bacterium]
MKQVVINLFSLLVIIAVMAAFSSCASTGRLTGGPKDVTPPILDTLGSTLNGQVHFRPKELVFYFNEFVEVKDPSKQILISPPLTYIPSVKARGKKVTFKFDTKEVLKDNATYTINFGDAIVDFTEGNKLQNFNFVFSTGAYLDSLNISGKIYNAQTGRAEPDMVVMLYDNLKDSIVSQEKPFYFAKPDKNGNFTFANIKSDTFRIFALKDENLNFKYDLPTEKIAFIDHLIALRGNSVDSVMMRASLPIPTLKIKSKNTKEYGKIIMQYNTTLPDSFHYKIIPEDIVHYGTVTNDSLVVFYDTQQDSFHIFTDLDTIKIAPKGRESWISKSKLQHKVLSPAKLHPDEPMRLQFNFPIELKNLAGLELLDTIGALDNVQFDLDESHRLLTVNFPWKNGETYTLHIDSTSIQSIYGHDFRNIEIDFKILMPEELATVQLDITDLSPEHNYVIRMLKEQALYKIFMVSGVDSVSYHLAELTPEKYNFEIIQDDNGNGQWDPGDFYLARQPEYYLLYKGGRIRENRTTNVKISWTDALKPVDESQSSSKSDNPFSQKK